MVAARTSWYKRAVTSSSGRLLIHLAPDRVRVIDLADVYYLERVLPVSRNATKRLWAVLTAR